MSPTGPYEGRRVIVGDGGGAGMEATAVRPLEPLGAEIHVIDVKEPPIHRQTPDEQAAPLVILNSPGASAITGAAILADGGTMAALSVGTLDVSAFGI